MGCQSIFWWMLNPVYAVYIPKNKTTFFVLKEAVDLLSNFFPLLYMHQPTVNFQFRNHSDLNVSCLAGGTNFSIPGSMLSAPELLAWNCRFLCGWHLELETILILWVTANWPSVANIKWFSNVWEFHRKPQIHTWSQIKFQKYWVTW